MKNIVLSLPNSKAFGLIKAFFVCLFASFLIGLLASLKIYVPFTPIAFVLQMQFIFLLALFLGAKKAFFATLLFLFQGALGLPVLASSTSFTLALGYYIGWAIAAFVIGSFAERKRTYMSAFLALFIGNYLITYFLGALIFSFYVGVKKAFLLGVLPFIIPDLIKNLLIIKLLKLVKWEDRKFF